MRKLIDHAGAWNKNHVRNPSIHDDILKRFGESCEFIYAGLAEPYRRCIIKNKFGEPDFTYIGMNGLCCDVCTES